MSPEEALKERLDEARTCSCPECRALVALAEVVVAAQKWRSGWYTHRRGVQGITHIDEENLARAVDALTTRCVASDSAPPDAGCSESGR